MFSHIAIWEAQFRLKLYQLYLRKGQGALLLLALIQLKQPMIILGTDLFSFPGRYSTNTTVMNDYIY